MYYDMPIVRNGLTVTWALCCSPDICMVYYLYIILYYLYSILYCSHSTQCSIKRGFLSNQNNIIVHPGEKHQISRKPRFQVLNQDFPPNTWPVLDVKRSLRPTLHAGLSSQATARLAPCSGWVPGGAPAPRLETRARPVSDWVMGGGVGGPEGTIPEGPATYCHTAICQAQIVPAQSQASFYFLCFWIHLPLVLLNTILVGVTRCPQSSALSTV